jgi:DNA-binding NtrC family response regulator
VSAGHVLFVEDEAPFRRFAGSYLEENGFSLHYAGSAIEAFDSVEEHGPPSVVLLDLNLPDLHGLEVLRQLRAKHKDVRVVVLTSYGDAANAVQALKAGATDYLTKPVQLGELLKVVRKAVQAPDPHGAPQAVEDAQPKTDRLHAPPPVGSRELWGQSRAWQAVLDRLRQVAERNFRVVLLLGESGTGKSAIARAFHDASPHRAGPFVEINCPSIPEALLESELFGYEKGAFTGAGARKQGQVEQAAGGTLFLDEIGDLPQAVQPKLLRFLEERTFRRVGGLEDQVVDTTVVCATNRDLERAVEGGGFRRDLFYRLEVVSLRLPSLRERGEDVLILAKRFLEAFARDDQPPQLSEDAQQALLSHPFQGNVRELRNLIQRAVAFSTPGELIVAGDLELGRGGSTRRPTGPTPRLLQPVDLEETLDAIEAHYVELALSRSASQREAAQLLGMDRFALARRRNRIARAGGADKAREAIGRVPSWTRAQLGDHPGDLPPGGLNLITLRDELEQQVIRRALRATDDNRARAATLTGMSRTSFARRLDAK